MYVDVITPDKTLKDEIRANKHFSLKCFAFSENNKTDRFSRDRWRELGTVVVLKDKIYDVFLHLFYIVHQQLFTIVMIVSKYIILI